MLAVFLLVAGLDSQVQAHNPDTSYARITLSSNAVECKFTFDIVTLLRITSLDANEDQQISRAEIETGATTIQAYLRQHVYQEINSADAVFEEALPPTWPEDVGASIPQADWHQRLIAFPFRTGVGRMPADVALIFDFFQDFGERHTVLGVFVHGSIEHPVLFTRLEPDYLYDLTVVDPPNQRSPPTQTNDVTTGLTNPPPTGSPKPASVNRRSSATESTWSRSIRFLEFGVEHIFLGYDHILFLIGLIVVGKFWDLVKIVTSFTVAHTITLILATLEVVSLPPRLIETAIALTIVYVAAENLWQKEPKHRWVLTFAFGLVHGFGFANVLRELELPDSGMMWTLLSFNLGVELGQLVIVAVLWPALWWLNRQKWSRRAKALVSAAILACGAAWFIDRAFALDFMPF